jgi:hypothetical protein
MNRASKRASFWKHNATATPWRNAEKASTLRGADAAPRFAAQPSPLESGESVRAVAAYAEDRLVMRRENPKYLHLILCVTFLYQMQRTVKEHPELGEYIETTLDDIAVANEIAAGLFGHSLDELSRPSRELLKLIRDFVEQKAVHEKCEREAVNFTRREVREYSGWSDYQIKAHIRQLEELEYLAPSSGRRGQLFAYRLAWDGSGERFLPGWSRSKSERKSQSSRAAE